MFFSRFFSSCPCFFTTDQRLVEAEAAQPIINVAAVVNPRQIQLGEKARLDLTISGDTTIKHIEAPKFNFSARIPRRTPPL